MRFDTLPDKLIKDALWCVWKYEDRDGKRTKVPYNPRTGGRAQSNNPATFSDFKTAVAAFGRCQYDGMGIFADAAEPKSIADLRGAGLKIYPCRKYPGSVIYGIRWLQNRKIVIDPKRTPHAWKEFTEYEYLTTKDGEFLADVPDENNHILDACRYALDRLINNRGVSA